LSSIPIVPTPCALTPKKSVDDRLGGAEDLRRPDQPIMIAVKPRPVSIPQIAPSLVARFQKIPRTMTGKKLAAASPKAKATTSATKPGRVDAEVAGDEHGEEDGDPPDPQPLPVGGVGPEDVPVDVVGDRAGDDDQQPEAVESAAASPPAATSAMMTARAGDLRQRQHDDVAVDARRKPVGAEQLRRLHEAVAVGVLQRDQPVCIQFCTQGTAAAPPHGWSGERAEHEVLGEDRDRRRGGVQQRDEEQRPPRAPARRRTLRTCRSARSRAAARRAHHQRDGDEQDVELERSVKGDE
jgi:hypothetical protein